MPLAEPIGLPKTPKTPKLQAPKPGFGAPRFAGPARRERFAAIPSLRPPDDPATAALRPHGFEMTEEERRNRGRQARALSVQQRIELFEKHSGRTLPTDLTLAAAESRLDDWELKRAARVFARRLNTPVVNFFPTAELFGRSIFLDPRTGNPITLRQARRIYKPFERQFYQVALKNLGIDPDYAVAIFRALAPIRGDEVSFEVALGMVAAVAKVVPPARFGLFEHNIRMVSGMLSLSEADRVTFALQATQRGVRFSEDPMDPTHPLQILLGDDPEASKRWNESLEKARQLLEGRPVVASRYPVIPQPSPIVVKPGVGVAAGEGLGSGPPGVEVDEQALADQPADVKYAVHLLTGSKKEYYKNYQLLAERIKAEYANREAEFKQSLIGSAFGLISTSLDKLSDAINAGVYASGSTIASAFAAISSLATFQHYFSLEDVMAEFEERMNAAHEMLYGDNTLAEQLTKDGVDPRLAFVLELGVQLAFDPLNIWGKTAHLEKIRRLISETRAGMSAKTWAERVWESLAKPQRWLGGKTMAEFLYAGAVKHAENPENFYEYVVGRFRNVVGTDGITPQVAEIIYRWVNLNKVIGTGRTVNQLVADINDILALALSAKVPFRGRPTALEDMLDALERSKPYRGLPQGWKLGPNHPSWQPWMMNKDLASFVEKDLRSFFDNIVTGRGKMQAIPEPGGFGTQMRLAIKRAIADTSFGAGVRYRRSALPSLMADLETTFPKWIEQYLARAKGLFSRAEIAKYRQMALDIATPFASRREVRFIKLLEHIQEEIVRRVAGQLGLSAGDAADFIREYRTQVRKLNEHLYGVDEGSYHQILEQLDSTDVPNRLREPLLETQLPNKWLMTDPVMIRQQLLEHMGYKQRIERLVAKALGKSVPKATLREVTANVIVNNQTIWLKDRFLRYWKAGVVATPRYMLRVPLGDEQLRFWADVGLWASIRARKMAAQLMDKLGVERAATWFDLDPVALREVQEAVSAAGFSSVDDALTATRLVEAGRGDIALSGSLGDLEKLPPWVRQVLSDTLRFEREGEKSVINPEWWKYFVFEPGPLRKADAPLSDREVVELYEREMELIRKAKQEGTIPENLRFLGHAIAVYDPETQILRINTDWLLSRDDVRIFGQPASIFKMGPMQALVAHEMGHHLLNNLPPDLFEEYLDIYARLEARSYGEVSEAVREALESGIARWETLHGPSITSGKVPEGALIRSRLPKQAYRDAHEYFADAWAVWSNSKREFARQFMDAVAPELREWLERNDERLVNLFKSIGGSVDVKFVPKHVNPRELKLRIVHPFPGELADEIAVNSGRSSEVFQAREAEMRSMLQRMAKKHEANARFYGVIEPSDPHYFDTLDDVLRNQVGRSSIGRMILRGIGQDKPADQIVDEVANWLRYDTMGRKVATRLHLRSKVEIDAHVEKLERMIRDWVVGDPEIAWMAYNNDQNLINLLREVPQEALSPVHGFAAAEATGRPHPFAVAWDYYSKAIFEWPTNKLSRQPFFKHWYTAIREGLTNALKEQGITPTEDMLRAIDTEARIFAIERVRRVMFDFRAQSRFGEMLSFVVPFHQPWKEAFVVWGHLLRKNWAFAERARILFRELTESGFFSRDPESGEMRVPMSNFLFMAPLLNMAYGKLKDGPGFFLSAPLASYNFLFGSLFEVPTGKLAGKVPVPVPSLNPMAMYFIQKVADNDELPDALKYSAIHWAYQFGSMQNLEGFTGGLLPTYVQHFLRSVGLGGQDIVRSQADDFLRLYEAQGITPQRYAKMKNITVEQAEKELAAKALQQAKQLSLWRTFMSWVFPAAPSIDFPTHELEEEYRRLIEEHGWDKGRDMFLERHPESALITIPTTYWSRPDSTVPIPANELAERFLTMPGVEEFAKQYPHWVFAFLPAEVWDQDFDRGVFFRQLDKGWRSIRGPLELFQEADAQTGWQLWRDARESWVATQEWLKAQNIDEGDPTWMRYKQEYDEYVEAIRTLYPGFAADMSVFERYNLDPWVENAVDQMLQNEMFRSTELGQALLEYRELRSWAMQRLSELNVSSINSETAKRAGITSAYQKGVAELKRRSQAFERAYEYFFNNDLQNVLTEGEKLIDSLTPEEFENLQRWEIRWEGILEKARTSSDPAEVSLAYLNMRDMANTAFKVYGDSDRNPLVIWWKTRSEAEKMQYAASVASRPYTLLSRFDRQYVLGEQVTDETEDYWIEIGKIDALIAKIRSENPGADLAPLYKVRDHKIKEFATRSSLFATQVEHANTWGWVFFHSPYSDYLDRPGREGEAWRSLWFSLRNIQETVDQLQLHGEADADPANRAVWREIQLRLRQTIEELKDYSPFFREEWERLEKENGSDYVLDSLMPETWFRLGGYDA